MHSKKLVPRETVDAASMNSDLIMIKKSLDLSNNRTSLWNAVMSVAIRQNNITHMVFLWRYYIRCSNTPGLRQVFLHPNHYNIAILAGNLRPFLLIHGWLIGLCGKTPNSSRRLDQMSSRMVKLLCKREIINPNWALNYAEHPVGLYLSSNAPLPRVMRALRKYITYERGRKMFINASWSGYSTVAKMLWRWGFGDWKDLDPKESFPDQIRRWVGQQISKFVITCRIEEVGTQGYLAFAISREVIDLVSRELTSCVDNANLKKSKVITLCGTHVIIDSKSWVIKLDAIVRFPLSKVKIPFLNGERIEIPISNIVICVLKTEKITL